MSLCKYENSRKTKPTHGFSTPFQRQTHAQYAYDSYLDAVNEAAEDGIAAQPTVSRGPDRFVSGNMVI